MPECLSSGSRHTFIEGSLLVVVQRLVEVFQLIADHGADDPTVEPGHPEARHQRGPQDLLLQHFWELPFWGAQRLQEHLKEPEEKSETLVNMIQYGIHAMVW